MARPVTRQPPRALVTRDAAAEYLSISCRHLDRLIAKGELSSVRLGHAVRIPVADLDRLALAGKRLNSTPDRDAAVPA